MVCVAAYCTINGVGAAELVASTVIAGVRKPAQSTETEVVRPIQLPRRLELKAMGAW
jgi:hypothetical protein